MNRILFRFFIFRNSVSKRKKIQSGLLAGLSTKISGFAYFVFVSFFVNASRTERVIRVPSVGWRDSSQRKKTNA